jgi:hypothetical protein
MGAVLEMRCAIRGARHRVNSVIHSGNVLHDDRYWRGSTWIGIKAEGVGMGEKGNVRWADDPVLYN